jgi:hypothetical protein
MRCHVWPKSFVRADHDAAPSLTMAVHVVVVAQSTLLTVSACGAVVGVHVAPPLPVASTTPLPGTDAPFEPTAMQ